MAQIQPLFCCKTNHPMIYFDHREEMENCPACKNRGLEFQNKKLQLALDAEIKMTDNLKIMNDKFKAFILPLGHGETCASVSLMHPGYACSCIQKDIQ